MLERAEEGGRKGETRRVRESFKIAAGFTSAKIKTALFRFCSAVADLCFKNMFLVTSRLRSPLPEVREEECGNTGDVLDIRGPCDASECRRDLWSCQKEKTATNHCVCTSRVFPVTRGRRSCHTHNFTLFHPWRVKTHTHRQCVWFLRRLL